MYEEKTSNTVICLYSRRRPSRNRFNVSFTICHVDDQIYVSFHNFVHMLLVCANAYNMDIGFDLIHYIFLLDLLLSCWHQDI